MSNAKLRLWLPTIRAKIQAFTTITLGELNQLVDEAEILVEANERLQAERRKATMRIIHAQECSFK